MEDKKLAKTDNSPAEMIRLAVKDGADLDKLEKLLTLQERWEANEARKVFASSFALAQEKIALVIKTKVNPQTHSKYADLGDIIESAKPVYTKEKFSVIFYEEETAKVKNVRVCADVLHSAGHKETYHYDVPLDGIGIKGNPNMTKIHGKSSSVSYGRRYLMCMIWNIPTGDDDGNAAGKPIEYIDDKQKNFIIDNLSDLNLSIDSFLKFMNLESLDKMPKANFKKAESAIKTKREKVGKK